MILNNLSNMKIIGLTGGTGSGKSTVSAYLKKRGCCIIDADKIAKEMTAKNGIAIQPIREAFGDEVFFEDGSLNRKKLGSIVFNDKEKLSILEEITTKAVACDIIDKIESLKKTDFEGIVILDIPLLFEFGMKNLTDENWLVTCERESRIKRLKTRDGLSRREIEDRMSKQLSDDQKMKMADYVIDNSGSISQLYHRVDQLIERLENEKDQKK